MSIDKTMSADKTKSIDKIVESVQTFPSKEYILDTLEYLLTTTVAHAERLDKLEKWYDGRLTVLEETLESLEPTLLPRRLDRLESRVEDAYDTASGADSALDDAREEIRKLNREIEELQGDVRRIQDQI